MMSNSRNYIEAHYSALLLLLFFFGMTEKGYSQRINFSVWTGSDDITVTSPQGVMPTLAFNQKQNLIIVGGPVVDIQLNDTQAVVYAIEAPEGFDLTVEVSAPNFLSFEDDPSNTIPFQLKMAYNNQQPANEWLGKASAVELPVGFNAITFPINRRLSGVPLPPPTPESGGYVRPKATAYLYLFGSLGPIGVIPSGKYSAEVNINVFFSTYD
jgi:hypothetical protein